MGKLKPCPFCGGSKLKFEYTSLPSYWVVCKSCAIRGPVMGGETFTFDGAEQAAITAWNTRALLGKESEDE